MEKNHERPEVEQEQSYSELLQIRRDKLTALREAGKDPYCETKYPVDAYAAEILESFQEDGPERSVCIAGRMMSKRGMGKASFCDLQDASGRIQLYLRKDAVGDEPYQDFLKFDIGDIIGIKGVVFRRT